jgi:hypothetical protein
MEWYWGRGRCLEGADMHFTWYTQDIARACTRLKKIDQDDAEITLFWLNNVCMLKWQYWSVFFYEHCSLLMIEYYCWVAVGTGVDNIGKTKLLVVVRTMLFSIVKSSCFKSVVKTRQYIGGWTTCFLVVQTINI